MKNQILDALRVSERPDPPPGDQEALKTFRASPKDLAYHYARWIPGQIMSLIGLIFSFLFLRAMEQGFEDSELAGIFPEPAARIAAALGGLDFGLTQLFFYLEVFAAITFVLQLFIRGYFIKLSWEMRWYMVGEEFLRIREGLWKVREQTVKIANIQNMTVQQGPVQRLFGIADLEIRTAGGGNASKLEEEASTGLHTARFRGLEDVQGLRDRLRERLRHRRDAGIGDAVPEPEISQTATPPSASDESEIAAAARELAREARDLRGLFAE